MHNKNTKTVLFFQAFAARKKKKLTSDPYSQNWAKMKSKPPSEERRTPNLAPRAPRQPSRSLHNKTPRTITAQI